MGNRNLDRGYLRRLMVRLRGIRQVRAAIFTEAMRQLAESRKWV